MQMIPPRPAQTTEPAVTPQAEQLTSAGWSKIERSGFLSLIGPLWHRMAEGEAEFALIAEDKHHNRRGVVQGGLLMTFADLSCGMTARLASGKSVVTVQMDTKFMDTTKIGEILQARPRDPNHPQPGICLRRNYRQQPLGGRRQWGFQDRRGLVANSSRKGLF